MCKFQVIIVQNKQRAPQVRLLLLLMLLLSYVKVNNTTRIKYFGYVQDNQSNDVKKMFGDKCRLTNECDFEGAVCDELSNRCLCRPEFSVTNHLDKCGIAAKVNESCFFNEQCEMELYKTECRNGVCACRFQQLSVIKDDGSIDCIHGVKKKFGDKCGLTNECGFEGAVCDEITNKCLCRPEFPVTNHLDKCGIAAKVNESCFFNEQCEKEFYKTECRDGVCACRFQRLSVIKDDGSIDCIPVPNTVTSQRYIDPAMIGILVVMFLMFITICIVLRLFSKARWQENRTIFNTPNPRLMNASLLRETKVPHHERRDSKASYAPSRPESVTSLQPHSPNSYHGSRRGSKGSDVSGTSGKNPKSPSKGAATPMLESVSVDIQGTKQ